MTKYNNSFFKIYRLFFIINCSVCLIALITCFFIPEKFTFLNHKLRVCSQNLSFLSTLTEFWLYDMIPMSILFLAGLTIYIPALSVSFSAFSGIILALDTFLLFSQYGIFFSLTMILIKLCILWLTIWYISYISTASIQLYTSEVSFVKTIDFIIIGKYIVWFAILALSLFLLDMAQCIMYRI